MTDNCFIPFSTFLVFFYEISRGSGVGWYFYTDGDVEEMERSPGSWSLPAAVTPVPLLNAGQSYEVRTQGPQVHQRAHS